MRPLRDTHAKFRPKIPFWGIEGGLLPLVASGFVSATLVAVAANTGKTFLVAPAMLPFALTFLYMLIFITGRRPHFAQDCVNALVMGKNAYVCPPNSQPRHPAIQTLERGKNASL